MRKRIILIAVVSIGVVGILSARAILHLHAAADRQKCASQLISLGYAVLMYSNENRGKLPPSWRELYLTQDATSEIFICPASDDVRATGATDKARAEQLMAAGHCSYRYVGGGRHIDLSPDIVLAVEKVSHHGSNYEANVLFGDGRVRHMSGAASKQIADAVARKERPVRYAGDEGIVMSKSGEAR